MVIIFKPQPYTQSGSTDNDIYPAWLSSVARLTMDPHAGCLQQCCPVLRHLPVTSPSRRSNCRKSVPASTALQIKRNKNKNLSVQNQLCVIKACTADTITALEISIQAWKKKKKATTTTAKKTHQKPYSRHMTIYVYLHASTASKYGC